MPDPDLVIVGGGLAGCVFGIGDDKEVGANLDGTLRFIERWSGRSCPGLCPPRRAHDRRRGFWRGRLKGHGDILTHSHHIARGQYSR